MQIPSPHNVMAKFLLARKVYVCLVLATCLSYLILNFFTLAVLEPVPLAARSKA